VIRVTDETDALPAGANEWIRSAAEAALLLEHRRGSMEIFAVEPEEIRALNREQRGIDRVTDVLSFPMAAPGETPADGYWGDIVLCPARAFEQAAEYGHSAERELAFLTVHGALHLFGYDHELPEEEAAMAAKQKAILERMGLPR